MPLVCKICFEDAQKAKARVTVCGHVFCKKCCALWFQTEQSCPVCRRIFTDVSKELIAIYDQEEPIGGAGDSASASLSKLPAEDEPIKVKELLGELGDRWQELIVEKVVLKRQLEDSKSENRNLLTKLQEIQRENDKLQQLLRAKAMPPSLRAP
ncbi:hypothetical protein CYMTET_14611 [Cymbomonas tetramitiformis]|uniref:RING-type domain-containing protein n=1 Tax=Cymbomonas tetramitiformis TaxID=36881 RepID=A0AAE0GFX9_9CHLO|nr:hypothetical protein CYMTET_14611 [Cymbomonas tetramitiformis]